MPAVRPQAITSIKKPGQMPEHTSLAAKHNAIRCV